MIEELLGGTAQSMLRMAPYEKIMNDAVHIMRSDFASIQMLYPKRGDGELRLLDFRGFNPEAAVFWEWVRADSQSTCGLALRDQRQVIASDIARSEIMAGSEDQKVYLQTGILACQTTPLIAMGEVVGMISTHWRTPHQPSSDDLRQFENLAARATEFIARRRRKAV
jgi:GAF domain-containing protein